MCCTVGRMQPHHTDSRALRQVVGEAARRVRQAAGARQEDVARHARAWGLAWDDSRIAALERGEKAISAEELALLPLVLSDACRERLTLADLIDPEERIRLSSTVTTPGRVLLDVYAARDVDQVPVRDLGPPVAVRVAAHMGVTPKQLATDWERYTTAQERLAELVPDVTEGRTAELLEAEGGAAERKAAARIGESALVVVAMSRLLWGRTLTDERDRIVSERADAGADSERLRALRGRVTRQLVDQLAREIKRREEAGDDGEHRETDH